MLYRKREIKNTHNILNIITENFYWTFKSFILNLLNVLVWTIFQNRRNSMQHLHSKPKMRTVPSLRRKIVRSHMLEVNKEHKSNKHSSKNWSTYKHFVHLRTLLRDILHIHHLVIQNKLEVRNWELELRCHRCYKTHQ